MDIENLTLEEFRDKASAMKHLHGLTAVLWAGRDRESHQYVLNYFPKGSYLSSVVPIIRIDWHNPYFPDYRIVNGLVSRTIRGKTNAGYCDELFWLDNRNLSPSEALAMVEELSNLNNGAPIMAPMITVTHCKEGDGCQGGK